jgi:tetratricopeptide (TPR) repeat protein
VSTLKNDLLSTVADRRQIDPRKLGQSLRGEMDWIVMKCLEKDRNRRYDSVGSLQRDVERYLDDEPVQACPPSSSYRLRKFARRNKTLLAAGGAIAAALFVGLGLSTWMFFRERAAVAVAKANEARATTEAARAKAVSALLQENRIQLGETLTLDQRAVLQPEDSQRRAMGSAARTEEARQQIRQVIEAYSQVAIEYPDDFDLRYKALDGYMIALKTCVATPGLEREVDELSRRLETELPKFLAAFPDSSDCQWNAAMCYLSLVRILFANSDRLSTLERASSQAADILEKVSLSDPDRPYVWIWLAHANTYLGDVQWRSGRPDDAEERFRTAMEIYDQHAAKIAADIAADPFHHINLEIIYAHLDYAFFSIATYREQEAAEFVRKAAFRAKRLDDPAELANSLRSIALAQLRLDDEAGYRATCKEMANLPIDSTDDLTKLRWIYTLCMWPDSIEHMSAVVQLADRLVANNSLGQRHKVLYASGSALFRDGQYQRAADRLEESIAVHPKHPLPADDIFNYQRLWLAMAKWKLGHEDAARRLLAEALPDVDQQIESPSCLADHRAHLEILREEAESLIGPKEADEARRDDNPIPPKH